MELTKDKKQCQQNLQCHSIKCATIDSSTSELKRYPRTPKKCIFHFDDDDDDDDDVKTRFISIAAFIIIIEIMVIIMMIIGDLTVGSLRHHHGEHRHHRNHDNWRSYCGWKIPDPSQATIPPVTSLPR